MDAGRFSSYLWQNGATTASITVSNTGIYYVTVTDNNGVKDPTPAALPPCCHCSLIFCYRPYQVQLRKIQVQPQPVFMQYL